MKLSRWHAVAAACGLGLFGLTGCEVSNVWFANCTTNPPVPHQDKGSVSMDIHAPAVVEAGSTFTLTVDVIGVVAGPNEPSPAGFGTFFITGGASPSGDIAVGDVFNPAHWPTTFEVTVTGQPGETIDIGLVSAGSVFGDQTFQYRLDCSPGRPTLATLQIVEAS